MNYLIFKDLHLKDFKSQFEVFPIYKQIIKLY